MIQRATEEEIETAEAISRLEGAERLPHIGRGRMPSLLKGTGRARRLKGGDDFGNIAALEKMTKSGSLRLEMGERIRVLLRSNALPMKRDDIHSKATAGLREHAWNEVARAYLTNQVAWGLRDLVVAKEISKLDKNGIEMRDDAGKVKGGRAAYYRDASAHMVVVTASTNAAPLDDAPYFVDAAELSDLFEWGGTKIAWTGATWNALLGCSKVSRACKNCYAVRTVNRGLHDVWNGLAENRGGKLVWTGTTRSVEDRLDVPRKWRRPRLIFQTSLSDPFHDGYFVETIQKHFDRMAETPHHIFQCLTKRPERAAALADQLRWPSNMWIGATIESDSEVWRADELRKIPVATKFISAEPLTTDDLPSLNLTDIDWLIVGGESGPGAEPMNPDWARSLRDRALSSRTAFFFKQWGAFGPDGRKRKAADDNTHLDGVEWFQFPPVAFDHGKRWQGVIPLRKARTAKLGVSAAPAVNDDEEPSYLDFYKDQDK